MNDAAANAWREAVRSRTQRISELSAALHAIAGVYEWHPDIPDDGQTGEGAALEECVRIARDALEKGTAPHV